MCLGFIYGALCIGMAGLASLMGGILQVEWINFTVVHNDTYITVDGDLLRAQESATWFK